MTATPNATETAEPDPTDPWLKDLTQAQAQAVTHVDGPLLILAGAGSGKTRVITRRIGYLVVEVGLAPWNIVAITFTNKAALEMRQRVESMLSSKQAQAVTVSTFHSLCVRILRRFGDQIGLPANFSIYNAADQIGVAKQALLDLDISSNNFPPRTITSAISAAKNELQDPNAYAGRASDFFARTVGRIYEKYQQILKKNRALDFDDLLLNTVRLMQQCPAALTNLREQYQYVLIDEYQDTNHAQFVIANALAQEHRNLCVTGDPDQSIYSWRGADIRNILEFEKHFQDATVIRLEQNYRSTKHICAAADGLIQQNRQRKHKSLWTENETGSPVTITRCYDEQHESQWVVQQFQRFHDEEKISWGQMAVFYRVNSLSRVAEEGFRSAAIPYQIARGTAFFDRKEVKDAVSYLRAIANPSDEINLLRVINTPARGISERSVKMLQAHAVASGITVADVIDRHAGSCGLNPRAVNAVEKFAQQLSIWRGRAQHTASSSNVPQPSEGPPLGASPASLAPGSEDLHSLRRFAESVFIESGLQRHYGKDKNDPDQERLANLGELISSAQQFDLAFDFEHADDLPTSLEPKLHAYLEQISLISDIDAVDPDQGSVTLMTLHAAKGLEFPVVAIIGIEDGLLPHSRSNQEPDGIEEERRLCFVGITRSQRHLLLTHTRYRTIFGQTQPVIPSRFLDELPSDATQVIDTSEDEPEMADDDHAVFDENDEGFIRHGMIVRHPQFGLGRVIDVNTRASQARANIRFERVGMKTLMLQYARLEIVSTRPIQESQS